MVTAFKCDICGSLFEDKYQSLAVSLDAGKFILDITTYLSAETVNEPTDLCASCLKGSLKKSLDYGDF